MLIWVSYLLFTIPYSENNMILVKHLFIYSALVLLTSCSGSSSTNADEFAAYPNAMTTGVIPGTILISTDSVVNTTSDGQ